MKDGRLRDLSCLTKNSLIQRTICDLLFYRKIEAGDAENIAVFIAAERRSAAARREHPVAVSRDVIHAALGIIGKDDLEPGRAGHIVVFQVPSIPFHAALALR